MCLDITKNITHIERKELDNIDNTTRVINSYELNDLVNFIEFARDDEDNTTNKCPFNFPDDVRSVYHAYRHYKYLLELTFVEKSTSKILRVFFKIHPDFDLKEYLVK